MIGGISARRVKALCLKETYQIFRDPSSILIAFVVPIVLLLVFGFGINLDTARIPLGLLVEDSSAAAAQFASALAGSPYIDAVVAATPGEVAADVQRGRTRGFIVVRSDFGKLLERPGDSAPIQIVTDGSDPSTAAFAEAYAKGVWRTWQLERAQGRATPVVAGVSVEPRYWFNPSAISRNFLIPGSITIIMTVVGALLTSLVVAREWERGTMEALLTTPVTRAELLLSKILPYYALGMASMTLCVAMAIGVMHVPFRASIPLLVLGSTLFLGNVLGMGLLLSTVTRNQFNAAQNALNIAFLPAVILSGFIFEISSMPPAVRAFTYLFPARYFVSALQTMFQAGTIGPLLAKDFLFLAAGASLFIGLTVRATRRTLD